jgi:hypothetical protein
MYARRPASSAKVRRECGGPQTARAARDSDGRRRARRRDRPAAGPLALTSASRASRPPTRRAGREPQHAVREQESRRLERQERAVRPSTHGRLVERRGRSTTTPAAPIHSVTASSSTRRGSGRGHSARGAARSRSRSCEPDALDGLPYTISVVTAEPIAAVASSPRARRRVESRGTPSSTRHQLLRRTSGASSATRWTREAPPSSRSRTTARWLRPGWPGWPSTTPPGQYAPPGGSATRDSPSGDVPVPDRGPRAGDGQSLERRRRLVGL